MAVPYTFGSATTSIPLSQLDSNFATTITLGNTAIQLGNTVTTLNNMTLASPTLTTPALGTPASGVMTNVTAIPAAQITGSQAIPKSTLPTGSVLQVVNATYSTESAISSSTFADTGLTANITPSSSTSKILVFVDIVGVFKNTNNTWGNFRLLGAGNTLIYLDLFACHSVICDGVSVSIHMICCFLCLGDCCLFAFGCLICLLLQCVCFCRRFFVSVEFKLVV